MDDLRREILGLIVQGVVFLIGLCISLGVGIELSAHTDGPGGLLVVTIVAGVGLLGGAVLSQVAHDRVAYPPG